MTGSRILAAALFTASLAPAFAGTDVRVPPFNAVEAHSGATVELRYGPQQHVTIVRGDLNASSIEVRNNSLDVEGCKGWLRCIGHHELRVEVVTPNVQSLQAHGGGDIRVIGTFPQQRQLNVQAFGGGDVDARGIPAENVTADAHGGGDVHVHALNSLRASAHGGGDIRYTGNPPHVSSETHGGGDVRHE